MKAMKQEAFKQTKIGKILKEWEVVELGTCIDVFSGYAFKREDLLTNKSKGVPIIKIGNLQNGKVIIDDKTSFVPRDFYEKLFDFQLHYGDVLIALSGATTGKIAVVDKDIGLALVNQRVGKFKILNSNISQKFFYFLAQSDNFKKFVLRNIGQSAQGNLSPNQVKKSKITLPPLPEQQKIAEILSTVDSAIEKVNQAIAKTERLKKGLMQELLTKGIGHKEFKDTEIGRIPKEWEVVRLGEVFSLEYGKGLTEKERENGEYPVYGSNGVVGYHSQYIVKGPGIIVGRKGTIGAITWSDRNFWPIDTTYYILLKKHKTVLKWLFYKLSSLKLAKLNMATGTPGLNRDLVYKLKLPLPPLPEQKKIAEILSTVDKRLELLRNKKEKMEGIKKGLMNDLLTGKKRVVL